MNLTQGKPHLLPLRATGNDLGAGQGVCNKQMLILLLQTSKPSVWECCVILMLFPTQTATNVNATVLCLGEWWVIFTAKYGGLLTDAQMSLNTTTHQNVYSRAILTSLTKSINGNLNVPLYSKHLLKEREFFNKSFKTCSRTHTLEYSLVVCSGGSAQTQTCRVTCWASAIVHTQTRSTHECTCPERQCTLGCPSS